MGGSANVFYPRQENGVFQNYNPVMMELVRLEEVRVTDRGSKIRQLSYRAGKKAKSAALLRSRAQSSRKQLEFSNLSSDWMIEGDDYINTSPSTAQGERYMIRTVFEISVSRGVHFFRAQIPVELGSQEKREWGNPGIPWISTTKAIQVHWNVWVQRKGCREKTSWRWELVKTKYFWW